MRPGLALIPAFALIALSASVGAQPQPIETGYWETRTDWLGLSGDAKRMCIKPKDVAKFLAGPSNHIYHCTYPISTAAGGTLRFEGTCVDKKGLEIKLRGEGEYTPTTVHMKASGSTTFLGIPVTGVASVNARFISSTCPEGAKAFS